MTKPKSGTASDNSQMHYSVGALIKKDGKYLLIDRIKPPLGYAGIAGHVDENEDQAQSLKREVMEETGLKVEGQKLLYEEELLWNPCRRGTKCHYWYLFACDVSGEIKQNFEEEKSIGWYSSDQIKKLELEEVWKYWFKKLKVI
jgi:8-oxo-dGTP pyrophosphatase MutT (NUDIX family)